MSKDKKKPRKPPPPPPPPPTRLLKYNEGPGGKKPDKKDG
jgi:hypothetical protein